MKFYKKTLTVALVAMSIVTTGCNDIAGNPMDEDSNSTQVSTTNNTDNSTKSMKSKESESTGAAVSPDTFVVRSIRRR